MVIIFNTVYMEKAKNSGVQLLQKKTGIKSLTTLNFFGVSYSLNTAASNVFVIQVNIIYPNEEMNKDLPAYTLHVRENRFVFFPVQKLHSSYFLMATDVSLCALNFTR